VLDTFMGAPIQGFQLKWELNICINYRFSLAQVSFYLSFDNALQGSHRNITPLAFLGFKGKRKELQK